MTYPTYGSLVTRVSADYDISDENFIPAAELLTLFNAALRSVEKTIHDLHFEDKYFLINGAINLVNGTADYALPTDIYASKIRHLWYENGSTKYEIPKMRNVKDYKFAMSGDGYEFLLMNTASGIVLRMLPTPTESGAYVKMLYIREIRRFVASTSDATNTLEIPEAEDAVIAHVKRGITRKMRRPDLTQVEDALFQAEMATLEASLKEMVPDENNLAQMDLTYYQTQMLEVLT